MSTKLIITNYKDNLISAKYIDDDCLYINICSNDNVGDIFIGRVENVVKSINACFIEFSSKTKGYYSFSENQNHIFLNNKNNNIPGAEEILNLLISKKPSLEVGPN